MKRFNYLTEFIISMVLIIMLILFINPFNFLMPGVVLMVMITVLTVIVVLFASLVWNENPKDERDYLHTMVAGRFAFLAGCIVLTLGIIIQSIQHNLSIWLPISLGVMVISKIISRIYSDHIS
jgi:hypothetical protein